MTPAENLTLAQEKLANAREALARIESLRESYDVRIPPLEERRTALATAVGDSVIMAALGEAPADHGDNLRDELAAVEREIAECTSARDAADRRVPPARAVVNHAGEEMRRTIKAVATACARSIEEETRDAFEKAFRLQRLWLVASETAQPGGGMWDGRPMLLHGDDGTPGSLATIAERAGVFQETCRPMMPLQALTLDELRELATKRAT